MRALSLLLLLAACAPGAGNQTTNGSGPPAPPGSPPPGRCQMGGNEEECVDFLPAERMQGVWVTGFEKSGFLPGATEAPGRDDVLSQRTWLTFARGATPDRSVWAERDSRGGQAAFAIEFIGRRSRGPGPGGGYGHLTGAEALVIVDRIVSLRVLGPPVIQRPATQPPAEGPAPGKEPQ
jgi:hypothetical protein